MGSAAFRLDTSLERDSTFVINLGLCQVRLNHNAAFPWILLIPKQASVFELIDLSSAQQQLLMHEISLSSKIMQQLFKPAKLNVASLGNMVPQLHIHIIARYLDDKAWPNPVWGSGINEAYLPKVMDNLVAQLQEAFLKTAQRESKA